MDAVLDQRLFQSEIFCKGMQIVQANSWEASHDLDCGTVVSLDIALLAIKRLIGIVSFVEHWRGQAKNHLGLGFFGDPLEDLLQIGLIVGQFHLMLARFAVQFQVMEAGVEMNHSRLKLDDPLVKMFKEIGRVATVGLGTTDIDLIFEILGHRRSIAHADGVANQDENRLGFGGLLGACIEP